LSQLAQLCSGEFVTRAENLLIFGLPGVGKTHFAAAVGHQLVQAGHSVLFTPTPWAFLIVAMGKSNCR